MRMVQTGEKAPDFSLPDQNGKEHTLKDYKGQWVLLYFYPKDDTPGCTKEACAMRDNLPSFRGFDAQVFGISKDSTDSHRKFEKKYDLNFPLLADENLEMMQAYGAWQLKVNFGKEYWGIKRMSVLIDPTGNVAKVYKSVKPDEHASQVLRDLEKLA